MATTYLIKWNRATRSLDGLEEFTDLDSAMAALDAAELAHLDSGEDLEIALVDEDKLANYVKV